MSHQRRTAGLMIVSAMLLAACTSIPKSETAASSFTQMDCNGLAGEMSKADETQRVADEAKRNAWQVIHPIAVGARYAHASWALAEAEDRKARLMHEQTQKGCVWFPVDPLPAVKVRFTPLFAVAPQHET